MHYNWATMISPSSHIDYILLHMWMSCYLLNYAWHMKNFVWKPSTAWSALFSCYITLHYRHFKRHLHLKWPVVHQQLHVIRNTAHRPSRQASYTASRVRPKRKISCAATQIAATLTISFPRWRHMSLTSYWGQQRMSLTSYPGLNCRRQISTSSNKYCKRYFKFSLSKRFSCLWQKGCHERRSPPVALEALQQTRLLQSLFKSSLGSRKTRLLLFMWVNLICTV